MISVRSVADAAAALAGGAAVVDVKEPANGPLGRAPDAVVAAVIRFVAGRRPVSAALGEFREGPPPVVRGLAYAKWGLAGCVDGPSWAHDLVSAADRLRPSAPGCRIVAVAYADWREARAPEPAAVADFARAQHWETLLVDTWRKDGKTLLDWLAPAEVMSLCRRCREAGVRVALAGSLGPSEITRLRPADPDWFAVRSAACRGGERGGDVCTERVRQLVQCVSGGTKSVCVSRSPPPPSTLHQ